MKKPVKPKKPSISQYKVSVVSFRYICPNKSHLSIIGKLLEKEGYIVSNDGILYCPEPTQEQKEAYENALAAYKIAMAQYENQYKAYLQQQLENIQDEISSL